MPPNSTILTDEYTAAFSGFSKPKSWKRRFEKFSKPRPSYPISGHVNISSSQSDSRLGSIEFYQLISTSDHSDRPTFVMKGLRCFLQCGRCIVLEPFRRSNEILCTHYRKLEDDQFKTYPVVFVERRRAQAQTGPILLRMFKQGQWRDWGSF